MKSPLAFALTSAPAPVLTRNELSICSRWGMPRSAKRIVTTPSRHAAIVTCCASAGSSSSNGSAADNIKQRKTTKKKVDEDETLDETAMRAAEIHEVLAGLKNFKTRIIDDATKLAKKVRAPKKQLEDALAAHPDILKIDGHIAELEEELKVLGDR